MYLNLSRVFVVCSRSHTTEALQAAFEKYGQLEDVWIVRDKFTKESRGVAYIKFSKMSEATLAVEKLDGKPLDDDTKPIKVALLSFYFECIADYSTIAVF